MLYLDVAGKDEDADLGELFADRVRGLQPLGGMRWRHPDVDNRQVGLAVANKLEELVCVARLADDLEIGSLEQARQPFAQKDVIVGHDDATSRGRLRFHDRPTLRRCPVAGRGASPPSAPKVAHWRAFGARPFDAIFVE